MEVPAVPDLQNRAADLILKTVPRLMGTLSSDLRRVAQNLSPGHFQILLFLAHGESNLTTLATELVVTLPTMSNTVSTLAQRGWVALRLDPTDRRRLMVSLSPEGWATLEEIRDIAIAKIEHTLESLTDVECRKVIEGLTILDGALAGDS